MTGSTLCAADAVTRLVRRLHLHVIKNAPGLTATDRALRPHRTSWKETMVEPKDKVPKELADRPCNEWRPVDGGVRCVCGASAAEHLNRESDDVPVVEAASLGKAAMDALYGLATRLHRRDLITVAMGITASELGESDLERQALRRAGLRAMARYGTELRSRSGEVAGVLAGLMPNRSAADRDRLWALLTEALRILSDVVAGRPIEDLAEVPEGTTPEQARQHVREAYEAQRDGALDDAVAP